VSKIQTAVHDKDIFPATGSQLPVDKENARALGISKRIVERVITEPDLGSQ